MPAPHSRLPLASLNTRSWKWGSVPGRQCRCHRVERAAEVGKCAAARADCEIATIPQQAERAVDRGSQLLHLQQANQHRSETDFSRDFQLVNCEPSLWKDSRRFWCVSARVQCLRTQLQQSILWQVRYTEKAHRQKGRQIGGVGRQHDHAEDAVGEAQQPDCPAAAAGLRHLRQPRSAARAQIDLLCCPEASTLPVRPVSEVGARART